jgi:hypothetical protein
MRAAALLAAALLAATPAAAASEPASAAPVAAAKKAKKKRCTTGSRAARRRCARRACARGRLSRRERRRLRCPKRKRAVQPPAPAPPAPAPGGSPGTPPDPGVPAPLGRYLGVTAREFSLVLSRPLLGAGTQTVELDNRGEDPHDLVIRPEGSATALYDFEEVGSGVVQTWPVALGPGRYELVCSIAGHEALGMKASLEVR